jgi:hypothetical protein
LSPLTKLFVGLLVVLSLLLTASVVTFVNTIDNQKRLAEQTEQKLKNEMAQKDAALAQAQSEKTQANDAMQLAQAQVEQLNQHSTASKQLLAQSDKSLAEAKTALAIQSADQTRLTEALKASEDAKSGLQDMVTKLRQSNDTSLQQMAQASQQISDLTNRLEITERERRFATEQLEEQRNANQKLGAAIQEMGKNPREILASATMGGAVGNPKINGVVKEVRTIAGLPYATISVGSADNVTKGMEFNIIERNGNFLGKLKIDTVELNEATGRITGPADKIAQVQKGVEVKTQL